MERGLLVTKVLLQFSPRTWRRRKARLTKAARKGQVAGGSQGAQARSSAGSQGAQTRSSAQAPFSASSPGAKGKRRRPKARGKSAPSPAAPTDEQNGSWVQVCRRGAKKKSEAPEQELGKPKASDWTGPVVTTAAELEHLITQKSDLKAVVAMPGTAEAAETIWELLGAHASLDVLFIFNYRTHDGFAEETKSALGVCPDRRTIPLHFGSGLRFVQRFSLTRGKDFPKPKVLGMAIEAPCTAKKDSVVLRAMTRRGLVSQWDEVAQGPGKALRAWLMRIDGKLSLLPGFLGLGAHRQGRLQGSCPSR